MKNINSRYDIIEKIGEGSTGSVFLVQDLMYNRIRRALKIIRTTCKESPTAAILRNEFSLLRQFDHPNIVKVYDYGTVIETDSGEHYDDFFFTLDYVRGKDLFQATVGADVDSIATLVFQIADALEYIHRRGHIHFDIKPENIIVSEIHIGNETIHVPKIIDFGFAAPLLGPLTESLKGSLHYIAPELIGGKHYDHRIDLYSLGVTIFQIVTRMLPFTANTPVEVIKKHQTALSANVKEFRPELQTELAELVSSLMEKDPESRIRSARLVAEIVAPFIRHSEIITQYSGEALPGGLVGRKKELHQLMRLVTEDIGTPDDPLRKRKKKIICVVGEQGVGKTPLLEEWRRKAQSEDILVIGTHCYLKTSPPLEPFRWFLHELRFVLLPRGSRAIELLARYDDLFSVLRYESPGEEYPKVPLDFADEEKKMEFLMRMVRCVQEAVGIVPFVVSIDDIHLADEMSIQLIRLLSQWSAGSSPLIVVSCDSIDLAEKELRLEPHDTVMIILGGIDDEGVAELIQAQIGISECSPELARAVSNSIGNSPYLIKEFINQFRGRTPEDARRELLKAVSAPTATGDIPRSINEVYEQRFYRRTPEERYLLSVISCFRTPVNKDVLEIICPYSPDLLGHSITMLTMSGILSLQGFGTKVRFTHARFQQYVYRHPHTDRSQLHKRIAATLEQMFAGSLEGEFEEIGYHYKEAGNPGRAFRYYVQAADRAATAFSLQESIMLLEECIQMAPDDDDRVSALEKLARQNDLIENYEKAEALYSDLLARPNVKISKMYRYLTALGSVQTRRGLLENASDTFTKARSAAHTAREIMDIEIELADIDISRGRLADARNRCIRALESLKELSTDPEQSSLFTKIGIISFYETKYEESAENFLKAFQILQRTGDKTKLIAPLLNLGNAYSVRRQYGKALESWTDALHYAMEIGNIHQQGQIYNNLGIAEYNQGHYDNALQKYSNGIEIFKQLGNAPGLALCLSNAGEVYLVQAEYEKALEAWESCLELHTAGSNAHGLVETHCHLSRLCLIFDETENAREHLQKSREIIERTNLEAKRPFYYLCSGAVALAEKNVIEAEQLFLTAQERFRTNRHDIRYSEVLLLGGRICRQYGRHDEAAAYFQEAVDIGVELQLPLIRAEALLELGIESRSIDRTSGKKTLVYLKEAFDAMTNESINDVAWKICYEIGKEFASRGLRSKSRDYFLKTQYALTYLGTLYTRQSLQKKFWESGQRGSTVNAVPSLIVDREG
jgi:tetratricopeptide (TPR) repeat protein